MKTQLRQSLILLLTAAIWGTSFVAQSVGMDYVGPFTFNSIRSLLGGLCLIPAIFLLDRLKYKNESVKPEYNKKRTLTGGVCCGIVLCLASNLQQIGMTHTTVAVSYTHLGLVPASARLCFLRWHYPDQVKGQRHSGGLNLSRTPPSPLI